MDQEQEHSKCDFYEENNQELQKLIHKLNIYKHYNHDFEKLKPLLFLGGQQHTKYKKGQLDEIFSVNVAHHWSLNYFTVLNDFINCKNGKYCKLK